MKKQFVFTYIRLDVYMWLIFRDIKLMVTFVIIIFFPEKLMLEGIIFKSLFTLISRISNVSNVYNILLYELKLFSSRIYPNSAVIGLLL